MAEAAAEAEAATAEAVVAAKVEELYDYSSWYPIALIASSATEQLIVSASCDV
jgi:hypothetical protein